MVSVFCMSIHCPNPLSLYHVSTGANTVTPDVHCISVFTSPNANWASLSIHSTYHLFQHTPQRQIFFMAHVVRIQCTQHTHPPQYTQHTHSSHTPLPMHMTYTLLTHTPPNAHDIHTPQCTPANAHHSHAHQCTCVYMYPHTHSHSTQDTYIADALITCTCTCSSIL